MPLSLRFVVPLALALAAIAYAVVPLVDRLTFQWTVRDLDMRGSLIVQAAQEPLVELMRSGPGARQRVLRYFQSIAQGQRIFALGFCDKAGKLAYATPAYPDSVRCVPGVREEQPLDRGRAPGGAAPAAATTRDDHRAPPAHPDTCRRERRVRCCPARRHARRRHACGAPPGGRLR